MYLIIKTIFRFSSSISIEQEKAMVCTYPNIMILENFKNNTHFIK